MTFIVAALLYALLAISNAEVLPLTVSDNQILIGGEQGSLSGMSFFWTNDDWGGLKFYNKQAVEWLKNDWKARVIRGAMGIDGTGGFLLDAPNNIARIKTLVDAAIECDLYCVVDWHDHYAHLHKDAAIAFFEEMARFYIDKNNLIFELFNEPKDDVSYTNDVKPYAEEVIKRIRDTGSTNVILVGSTHWDQDVEQAAAEKITSYENIAYTLHFYANAEGHGQALRDKATAALQNHIALFVSEWGTVDANGDGTVNAEETKAWVDFMKANHLSNCNWSLNDKAESASALKPGVRVDGQWTDSDLTESGKLVRDIIRTW
ncbi:endoglucanase Z-like [Belonocnema kinseyi]|uniref:endoglucanase Z-like n=1 Tax=Belonocnema kinseyi TaxID=2817044 RepID=UPI00143D31A3|nr:endoglucanase Z-like [Belonocnema kinseyi]XP_033231158.1 endoglucanase Z-like [Belonocnema kinseyi]